MKMDIAETEWEAHKDWREWFAKMGELNLLSNIGSFIHKDESINHGWTVEEQYQAFKARLLEELKRDGDAPC